MLDAGLLMKELQDLRDSGHLSDALLRHAVKKIEASDSRYDWVGVYLMNEANDGLWLHNYVGAPTEHARIAIGEGVCGTAIQQGRNMNVPDVTAVENYLACNPDTRSEMVVLIRAGDEIFGQIDLDSTEDNAFTARDEEALQIVADKLAEQIAAERR